MSKMTPQAKLRKKNRKAARETIQAQILDWYLALSGGVMPEEQVEHTDAHGQYQWRLYPEIPGHDNPVLVEKELGNDSWGCEIVYVAPKIRVFLK